MKILYIVIAIFAILLAIGYYATRNSDRESLKPIVNEGNKENYTNK